MRTTMHRQSETAFPFEQLFRPFLTQSDLSVENGLFRLKPKSGFLTQLFRQDPPVEKSVEKVLHVSF